MAAVKRKGSRSSPRAKGTARGAKPRHSREKSNAPPPGRTLSAKIRRPARVDLLIGTRKGAFILRGDRTRKSWTLDGPHFLGSTINHMVLDPRDRRTLLMAARTGHLGPTIFRSSDRGKTWKEATRPPAFAKVAEAEDGRAVNHTFWLSPAHEREPNLWYAGTSPHGLFRSEDGGSSWDEVEGFSEYLQQLQRLEGAVGTTPDGALTHSILVHPDDSSHIYVGLSTGGVFESPDRGDSWRPLNKGVAADFLPVEDPPFGHDPHTVVLHPLKPDRLYQQNHCGIYRIDRPSPAWVRIGDNMPREVGDIGFPIVLHPRDPDTAWVLPMDGTSVWPRTSPGGKPAVYRTTDGGSSWGRQDRGFPSSQAWLTVLRQAMAADDFDPVGLYFGTTNGDIWMSENEGRNWRNVFRHLPRILSIRTGAFA